MHLRYIMVYLEIRLSRARTAYSVFESRNRQSGEECASDWNFRLVDCAGTRRSLKRSAGQIVSDTLPRSNLYMVIQRDRQV